MGFIPHGITVKKNGMFQPVFFWGIYFQAGATKLAKGDSMAKDRIIRTQTTERIADAFTKDFATNAQSFTPLC